MSCGGGNTGGEGDYTSCVPTELTYVPQKTGVYLEWRPNCGKQRALKGYNFYITPAQNAAAGFPKKPGEPHNRVPYPGDTNPGRRIETAELKELDTGVEYLAVVRIVFADGSQSKPSNVVRFSALPSGEFTLVGRYQGDNDGFALARGVHVRADNSANDLYFMARNNGDFLLAPSKLGFGLKSVRLSKVGAYESLAKAAGANSPGGGSEEIRVSTGDLIELRIEGKHYARVFVKSVSGNGKARSINLQYVYQPSAGKKSF
ncbi:MAG: hypothetical protein ACE5GA_05455 [Candidatus Zixiibacteriota bacterium]